MDSKAVAHGLALFTVFVWGLTFISTKNLLQHYTPVEILVIRFAIGILALFPLYPHLLRLEDRREEIDFALAGLIGICLYYLLENIALSYTYATNVGVIVAVVPFFTAILSSFRETRRGSEPGSSPDSSYPCQESPSSPSAAEARDSI